MYSFLHNKKGFTLIELIITIVLISILVAVAGLGIVPIAKGFILAKDNAETIQKVQIAMARIVKELGAESTVSASPAPSSNSIYYTRSDGVSNNITYTGDTIQITGSTLINNVTAFAMTYYAADGSTTATAANIRRVKIDLTVTGANNQPSSFTNSICVQESYW